MQPHLVTQQQNNRETRGEWLAFAGHRRIVTQLAARHSGERLTLLGAGNCNDIDLDHLASNFHSIDLVDIDGDALDWARQRYPFTAAHVADLSAWPGPTDPAENCLVDDDQHQSWLSTTAAGVRPSGPAADCVLSLCVASQLIDGVAARMGPNHPRLAEALLAERDGHLQTLLNWRTEGGSALLITDFLASDTCPELNTCQERELPDLLRRELNRRNFFSGLNPTAVKSRWEELAQTRVHITKPWKWSMGARVYAVCAFELGGPTA